MDIEYLLFLQNFRNSINDALTPFMYGITDFSVHAILFLPVFVYWCLNKKRGLVILTAFRISVLLNAVVKLTACVCRPWVRDARIIPAGNSISGAGGYSFPSGHTMMCAPIYTGLAMYSRKYKPLSVLFILAMLTTMFSRNYLGVHTPQDVLVGCVLGLLSVWIAEKVFAYLDNHPENENKLLAAGFIIATAAFAYVNLKTYPMDYVDGKLLVDPKTMTIDAWGDIGGMWALVIACIIEKKWVKFTETGFNFKGVLLCIIGLIPLYFMIYKLKGTLGVYVGPHWAKLLQHLIEMFYIIVLWPVVLKVFAKKS